MKEFDLVSFIEMFRSVALLSLRLVRLTSQKVCSQKRLSFRSFTNAMNETSLHNTKNTFPRREQKGNVVVKQLLDSHAKGKVTDQASRVAALQQIAHSASSSAEDRRELMEGKFQIHFENLLDEVGANIKESRRQELSVILWSLGKLRARQPWLVKECEKRLLDLNVKQMSDTQLCMISWGLAQTAVQKSEKLLKRIKAETLRRGTRSLTDTKLCMLLRAFTDPQMKNVEIFKFFEEEMFIRGFSTCSEELLAQCALSFARTNYGSGSLFKGIADELVQRDLTQLTERALADLVWSFSKANIKHSDLMGKIQEQLTERSLNKFETENLVKIAWALARQKPRPGSAEVLKSIENQLLQYDLLRMSEGNIVQTLWAFAHTGVGSDRIFKFFEDLLLKRDLTHSPRKHLYLMAWSFAKCHPQAVTLLEKIFKNIDSQGLSKFGRRERSDLKLIKEKLFKATI